MHPIFQPKVMTEVVRRYPPQGLFFQQALFPNKEVTSTTAEWDVLDGAQDLADYSHPGTEGAIVRGTVRSRVSQTMPRMRVKLPIAGMDINLSSAPGSYTDRYGQAKVTDELAQLSRRVDQRREWACAQVLTGDNTLTITWPDGATTVIDYGVQSSHRPTAGVTWATASTNVISDIMTWCGLIEADAGIVAAHLWVDRTAHGYLINNTTIQNYMKETSAAETIIKEGVIQRLCGLDVHMYTNGYKPVGGSFTAYMPAGHVLITARPEDMLASTLVGPSEDIKADGSPGRFSKSWETEDPSGVTVLVEEYSLPALGIPDGIVYADIIP